MNVGYMNKSQLKHFSWFSYIALNGLTEAIQLEK